MSKYRIMISLVLLVMIAVTENQVDKLQVKAETADISDVMFQQIQESQIRDAQYPDGYSLKKEKRTEISKQHKFLIRSKGSSIGENLSWSVDGNVLEISGMGDINDFSIDDNKNPTTPWYPYADSINKIVVKEGVTGLGIDSFANMSSCTSIDLPETLTKIGEAAFYGCSSLTMVKIPNSVKEIDTAAFANCTSLRSVELGEGVHSLGEYTFQNTAVQTITFPANLTEMEDYALFSTNLTEVNVARDNKVFSSYDGILLRNNETELVFYPTGRIDTSYKIPMGVTEIGAGAFANTSNLQRVDFSNVKKLCDAAFMNSGLADDLILPDSLTEVEDFSFEGCKYITSVTFGNGLKESGYRMFEGCSRIKEIFFGSSLQTVGMRSFNKCNSLADVELPATITAMEGSFGYCKSLKSFKSENIKDIWYASFAGDSELCEVTLNNVESINREAFNGCDALASITLPQSTQYVDSTAFPKWTNIYCMNTELTKYGINGLRYAEEISFNGRQRYDLAFEVVDLVNEERRKYGLSSLTLTGNLTDIAMQRAAENLVLFSHTRPDGSICFSAGDFQAENIAIGQKTAKDVMNSWMNSDGHRENILNSEWVTIGIGCFEQDGEIAWSQNFSTESSQSVVSASDYAAITNIKTSVLISRDTFSEAPAGAGISFSSGDDEYTYKVSVGLGESSLDVGKTTNAKLYLNNPLYSIKVCLDNNIVSWKSGNSSIATIDNYGNVKGNTKGKTTITGSTQYFSASRTLGVGVAVDDEEADDDNGEIIVSKDISLCRIVCTRFGTIPYRNSEDSDKIYNKYIAIYDSGRKLVYEKDYMYSGCGGESENGSAWKTRYLVIKGKGKYRGKLILRYPGISKKPDFISIKQTSSGIRLKWKKEKYSTGYAVYRKIGNGTFKRLAVTNNVANTQYVDKSVKKGVKYTYFVKVKTINGNKTLYSKNSKKISVVR